MTLSVYPTGRAKPNAPLAPGLRRIDIECAHLAPDATPAALTAASLTGDVPPCRSIDDGVIFNSGGTSMDQLASIIRGAVG